LFVSKDGGRKSPLKNRPASTTITVSPFHDIERGVGARLLPGNHRMGKPSGSTLTTIKTRRHRHASAGNTGSGLASASASTASDGVPAAPADGHPACWRGSIDHFWNFGADWEAVSVYDLNSLGKKRRRSRKDCHSRDSRNSGIIVFIFCFR